MNAQDQYDLVVIGGGITGAGIFYQSVFSGFRTLLLEAKDFSFGTSSRSGKLIHGGYRYLQNGQFGVSYHSIQERELLIKRSANLVERIPFVYLSKEPGWLDLLRNRVAMQAYLFFAGKYGFQKFKEQAINEVIGIPQVNDVQEGFDFSEGHTDDSRLTLRLIFDAIQMGGKVRNYSAVAGLLKTADGRHCGVTVRENKENGSTYEVRAKAIINATGIWTDDVCRSLGTSPRIRRQRGSHLIIPFEKLPLKRGVMFNHPADNRIQFAIPWYGRVLLGTTDLDEPVQDYGITDEPDISPKELDYLLYSINTEFPGSDVKTSDIIATFCGIRPIVRNNSDRPYASSRKFQIWDDNGMVTIAGGKLTTFQHMGYQALKHAQKYLDKAIQPDTQHAFLSQEQRLDRELKSELVEKPLIRQKYGLNAAAYLRDQQDDPQAAASIIAGQFTQADIRWAARREMVAHLDDLLLRRTRIGLLLKDGGVSEIESLKKELKQDLSWDEGKWNAEVARYKKIWQAKYSLPL